MEWFDVFGTLGVVLIIITYAGVQSRRMIATSLSYSVLNLVGAGMIIVSLVFNFNFASFVIEIFWILISLWGILNWFRFRQKSKQGFQNGDQA